MTVRASNSYSGSQMHLFVFTYHEWLKSLFVLRHLYSKPYDSHWGRTMFHHSSNTRLSPKKIRLINEQIEKIKKDY